MMKEWKAIHTQKANIYHCHDWVALIPALYNIIFLSSMWDPIWPSFGSSCSGCPIRINLLHIMDKDGNRKRHGVQFEGQ